MVRVTGCWLPPAPEDTGFRLAVIMKTITDDDIDRVALDLDSTLAATSLTAFELLGTPEYTYDDIESWSWGLNKFGKERYLNAMWHAWTIRPTDVPVMEAGLPETVSEMRDHATVDVVTAHPENEAISNGKKQWLDHIGIGYNDFVPVTSGKAELGYDAYVDDKPALPGEVAEKNPEATSFVIDHQYNQNIEAPHVRVGGVSNTI